MLAIFLYYIKVYLNMVEIRKFHETDEEFKELAQIDNLVNHDSISHPDDDKDNWIIRDKSLIRDRLLLYNEDTLIGVLYYSQGRDENSRTTFFTTHLDPNYNNHYQLRSIKTPGLANIAATICNLLGFEAPATYEPSLIKPKS